MSKFLHNSEAWSKQDNGLVIAPFATWIKKDLINNILLPLLASPCRPLTLFSPLVPREGSLRSLTDSCRNLRPEEICALGGISLCGRKALVWLFPLSMLAREILPIHVTEGTANLVACFVNCAEPCCKGRGFWYRYSWVCVNRGNCPFCSIGIVSYSFYLESKDASLND